ncbi:MAG: ABC transporter permease subunit [Clostridia bacterium]|nr:ABC transporter permease subunit [Clostridia bacterium]
MTSICKKLKNRKEDLLCALFWLCVWQAASMLVGQEILLASPAATARALLRLLRQASFYRSVLNSFGRILLGFVLGLSSGVLLAVLSLYSRGLRALLRLPMQAVKAAPVASFIILALVWFSSRHISVFISYLMVLPAIYLNTLSGLSAADPKLLEMAKVFSVSPGRVLRQIRLPAAVPHLLTACHLSLGLCWKAGIAAEVIGQPDRSIGDALFRSKLFLLTDELFAWTLIIVILSVVFEKAAVGALTRIANRRGAAGHD